MSTQAKSAYSTTLKSDGTEIAELTSISGPSQKIKDIDVTNMDSPDGYNEHIPGLVDSGQISIEGNWTNAASQTTAYTDFQARTTHTFVITTPGPHTFTVSGFWSEISTDAKTTAALTFKASIQCSGKPVYA